MGKSKNIDFIEIFLELFFEEKELKINVTI